MGVGSTCLKIVSRLGEWASSKKTYKDMTESKVTPQEFKRLKEHLTARMIQILAEEQGYSLEDAVNRVYTSPIYEKLSDASTGLYFQSPRYVLSYL